MSIELNGSTGIDFNDGSNQSTAATPYGRKNLIINGDMRIAQRGTSATGLTGTSYPTIDRFRLGGQTFGTWTMEQDTDVPSGQGFVNSLKLSCTTANASLSVDSVLTLQNRIEGYNLQHLKFGTSSAETLTLSFWVKSNKTGTYTFWINQPDDNRAISPTFTIDTADTWEKKTITIDGDTTGVIDNDNGEGLRVGLFLVAGTDYTSGTLQTDWATDTTANRVSSSNVNLADSTSNYINITGCQLEIGDAASDFEFVPFDMELQRCERYYQKSYNISSPPANIDTSGQEVFQIDDGALQRDGIRYRTRMRQSGSINIYNPVTGTSGEIRTNSGNNYSLGLYAGGETGLFISYSPAAGQFLSFHWTADSEL